MLETVVRGKSYMPLRITNAMEFTSKNSSECQRLIANMKKQKNRHSILPMLANMATRLWRFVQMTDIFVMSRTFQYKISVPLIKQFGTKIMVRLIDLAKFVATSGI